MNTERNIERDVDGMRLAIDGWLDTLHAPPGGQSTRPAAGPGQWAEAFAEQLADFAQPLGWAPEVFGAEIEERLLTFLLSTLSVPLEADPGAALPYRYPWSFQVSGPFDLPGPLLLSRRVMLEQLALSARRRVPRRRTVRARSAPVARGGVPVVTLPRPISPAAAPGEQPLATRHQERPQEGTAVPFSEGRQGPGYRFGVEPPDFPDQARAEGPDGESGGFLSPAIPVTTGLDAVTVRPMETVPIGPAPAAGRTPLSRAATTPFPRVLRARPSRPSGRPLAGRLRSMLEGQGTGPTARAGGAQIPVPDRELLRTPGELLPPHAGPDTGASLVHEDVVWLEGGALEEMSPAVSTGLPPGRDDVGMSVGRSPGGEDPGPAASAGPVGGEEITRIRLDPFGGLAPSWLAETGAQDDIVVGTGRVTIGDAPGRTARVTRLELGPASPFSPQHRVGGAVPSRVPVAPDGPVLSRTRETLHAESPTAGPARLSARLTPDDGGQESLSTRVEVPGTTWHPPGRIEPRGAVSATAEKPGRGEVSPAAGDVPSAPGASAGFPGSRSTITPVHDDRPWTPAPTVRPRRGEAAVESGMPSETVVTLPMAALSPEQMVSRDSAWTGVIRGTPVRADETPDWTVVPATPRATRPVMDRPGALLSTTTPIVERGTSAIPATTVTRIATGGVGVSRPVGLDQTRRSGPTSRFLGDDTWPLAVDTVVGAAPPPGFHAERMGLESESLPDFSPRPSESTPVAAGSRSGAPEAVSRDSAWPFSASAMPLYPLSLLKVPERAGTGRPGTPGALALSHGTSQPEMPGRRLFDEAHPRGATRPGTEHLVGEPEPLALQTDLEHLSDRRGDAVGGPVDPTAVGGVGGTGGPVEGGRESQPPAAPVVAPRMAAVPVRRPGRPVLRAALSRPGATSQTVSRVSEWVDGLTDKDTSRWSLAALPHADAAVEIPGHDPFESGSSPRTQASPMPDAAISRPDGDKVVVPPAGAWRVPRSPVDWVFATRGQVPWRSEVEAGRVGVGLPGTVLPPRGRGEVAREGETRTLPVSHSVSQGGEAAPLGWHGPSFPVEQPEEPAGFDTFPSSVRLPLAMARGRDHVAVSGAGGLRPLPGVQRSPLSLVRGDPVWKTAERGFLSRPLSLGGRVLAPWKPLSTDAGDESLAEAPVPVGGRGLPPASGFVFVTPGEPAEMGEPVVSLAEFFEPPPAQAPVEGLLPRSLMKAQPTDQVAADSGPAEGWAGEVPLPGAPGSGPAGGTAFGPAIWEPWGRLGTPVLRALSVGLDRDLLQERGEATRIGVDHPMASVASSPILSGMDQAALAARRAIPGRETAREPAPQVARPEGVVTPVSDRAMAAFPDRTSWTVPFQPVLSRMAQPPTERPPGVLSDLLFPAGRTAASGPEKAGAVGDRASWPLTPGFAGEDRDRPAHQPGEPAGSVVVSSRGAWRFPATGGLVSGVAEGQARVSDWVEARLAASLGRLAGGFARADRAAVPGTTVAGSPPPPGRISYASDLLPEPSAGSAGSDDVQPFEWGVVAVSPRVPTSRRTPVAAVRPSPARSAVAPSASRPTGPSTWASIARAVDALADSLKQRAGVDVQRLSGDVASGLPLSLLAAPPVPKDAGGVAQGVYMQQVEKAEEAPLQRPRAEQEPVKDFEVWGMEQVVAELRWRMRIQEKWDSELE